MFISKFVTNLEDLFSTLFNLKNQIDTKGLQIKTNVAQVFQQPEMKKKIGCQNSPTRSCIPVYCHTCKNCCKKIIGNVATQPENHILT